MARARKAAKRASGREAPRSSRKQASRRTQPERTIGYAVVGVGHIAQQAVLPAFKNAKNSRLVALVSGDAEKRDALARRYKVKHTFDYEQLEECLALDEVDAVYIALPNDLHRDFAVRAARAGVHVLCEKPMALDEDECRAMTDACRENDVKLMIAYRLHFEPANLAAVQAIRDGKLGEPKLFTSSFSYQVQPDNIRTQRERGGGPTWDIGIYCINAARYLFQAEPEEVFAFATGGGDARFEEVEEGLAATMRFPGGKLATFEVSYGAAPTGWYQVVGTKGEVCLEEAYEYEGSHALSLTVDERTREQTFKPTDQFGPELLYFSRCILEDRDPEPSGEEGLADVRIIRALLESAETGRPVKVEAIAKAVRPSQDQKIARPAVKPAGLVHVEAPSQ